MNLYEILGVPRDATPGDIRLAFRREASKAHPDRGGDAARMQDVNKAYEVLSDPERRKQYDETGALETGPTLRYQATQQIALALNAVIEAGSDNVLEDIRRAIDHSVEQMREQLLNLSARRQRLQKLSGKVKTKAEVNIVQGVIDQQLAMIPDSVKRIREAIQVLDEAVRVLDEYRHEGDMLNEHLLFQSGGFGPMFFNTGTKA